MGFTIHKNRIRLIISALWPGLIIMEDGKNETDDNNIGFALWLWDHPNQTKDQCWNIHCRQFALISQSKQPENAINVPDPKYLHSQF
jgi:hypothetical protein